MSERQPIDLDDLQRVGVLVREKTDDNWLADMVEIACDEIARLREERRSITTLLGKVESLEADNAKLREERGTLLESQLWGVNCKPTPPEAAG